MNATELNAGGTGALHNLVVRGLDLQTDIPRFTRLLNETDEADGIFQVRTEEQMRNFVIRPGSDPARDRWLVEEPGNADRIIASGYTFKTPTANDALVMITVHPGWRRRGIGGALLELALARARELGATYVLTSVDTRRPFTERFAEQHGFSRTGINVEMLADTDVQLAEPILAAGYSVRSYDQVNELPILLEAVNRGFIGHHEHSDATLEELEHWLRTPSTRSDGIFLAFGPQGDVAGLCWAEIDPVRTARRGAPTGYIDSLAVVPEHRRHGLGRALLLTGMRWLRDNGQGPIELEAWGANEMALPLYEAVGFRVFRQLTEYRRDF